MGAAVWLIWPLLVVGITLLVWLNWYVWPRAWRQWRELPQRRRANQEFLRAHPVPDSASAATRQANTIGVGLLAGLLICLAVVVVVLVLV